MTRIALVAHLSEVSGSGIALLDIACALKDFGHQVFLVLPAMGLLADRALARGITPTIIPISEIAISEVATGKKLQLLWDRFLYIKRLRSFFRKEQVDLAYLNTSATIFPGVSARLAGVPIVWHIHETLSAPGGKTIWKIRLIQRLANGLIYASESGLATLPPPDDSPYIIARNFVPVKKLLLLRDRRRQQKTAIDSTTIFINGTIARKGADILLSAVQLLMRQYPHLSPRIEIAGMPATEPDFAARIDQLVESPELQGRVQFTGLVESLLPHLEKASIFVSASRNEALPIAIVESMAAGVPVIATDVGDCAELLEHGRCGWVVPAEDPVALADAISEALANPEVAAAKADAAFEKVNRLYGSEDFWQPLVQFLESVMSRR